ncbi:5-oxoprolinase subunit PxpB [Occultella glacieicola]|uniref:5-oxoprolinase subunit PxpB n=1 Tax=Occultella glacieicola TaxID=2518684 RepID=A0ABY2E6F4_9MICO|nr:5-oxoprolinase subunit PxpB [Occultella glacieicola]TDE95951.1 5-oxoprolinase subunit PxpB [Occultella glacieicola]
MLIRPSGERAVLVEVDTLAQTHALATALGAASDPRILDVVPAARTVLVVVDTTAHLADVAARVRTLDLTAVEAAPAGDPVRIAVDYDGTDLADVAEATGLTEAEVVARHTAPEYIVDFIGFAPGFGYLSGLDPALHLPRLPTPRPSVPAGSVAIAADRTAVYPRASPGGWRLLGRTDAALFDVTAEPPALLRAGMRVRFEVAG